MIENWKKLAARIKDDYNQAMGFVIVSPLKHLCHIASGLSYTFENLGKPVILTSGFRRIDFCNNDSSPNLFGSIMIAGNHLIPEVSIYCNDRLLRGNRAVRQSCDSTNLYDTPNYPPLAHISDEVTISWESILNPPFPGEEFSLNLEFSSCIERIVLHPQLNEEVIAEAYEEKSLEPMRKASEDLPLIFINRGVILESFGNGRLVF